MRDLSRGKHARRFRRERYRADSARIGPELKVPLETARLLMDVLEAAYVAALRVVARHRAGLPAASSEDRLVEVLEVLLQAGCEPPQVD